MRAHFVLELNGSTFEKSLDLPFTPAVGMSVVVCNDAHSSCYIRYASYELDNELWYVGLELRPETRNALECYPVFMRGLLKSLVKNGWHNYTE